LDGEHFTLLERARLAQKFFAVPREESSDYHVCRRVQVIEDLAALCNRHLKRTIAPGEFDESDPVNKLADTFPLICPTMCLFCLGNKKRITFSRPGHLRRHVRDTHLRYCKDVDSSFPCPHPECKENLKGVMHFRNHAAVIHGTNL
jgi:hypothetical protein